MENYRKNFNMDVRKKTLTVCRKRVCRVISKIYQEFENKNNLVNDVSRVIYFFFGPNGSPMFLPLNLTPKALSNLAKICWFGMALLAS